MKSDKLLLELEDLVAGIGYKIRREKGNFNGGNCVLEGEMLILLNKNQPPEVHIGTLSRLIKSRSHQQLYMKPAVRKALEEIWDRSSNNSEPELDFSRENSG